ncbi:hypothetical protein BDR26DRAFT_850776 [Obelidium mucronatum]|nr:hypothetical protein BDR26DRAFT_850776 [Obelidium mucronatum]
MVVVTATTLVRALFADDSTAIAESIAAIGGRLESNGLAAVAVDGEGNTLHHWAATFANVPLLEAMSPVAAANYNRETPLIRCVMATAAYDNNNFSQVLKAIIRDAPDFASLFSTDSQGRSVLHHISLSSGIKGRVYAARYYMDELFINTQDVNGDTALNVASRMGDLNLVGSLVDGLKARTGIPNLAGLTAKDFGVSVTETAVEPWLQNSSGAAGRERERENEVIASLMELGNVSQSSPRNINHSLKKDVEEEEIHIIPISAFMQSSQSKLSTIKSTVSSLHTEFNQIQTTYSTLLHKAKSDKLHASKKHSQIRRKHESLVAQSQSIPLLQKRIQKLTNIVRDCTQQKSRVEEAVEELAAVGCLTIPPPRLPQSSTSSFSHTFPASSEKPKKNPNLNNSSSPHKVTSPGGKKVLLQMDSLRSYIQKKELQESEYLTKIESVKSVKGPYEQLCKAVFSSCCNIPLEHADQLIDPLLDWLDEQGQNSDDELS